MTMAVSCWLSFMQISAFRGLKPSGKAAKSRKEEESNQDDLASRLQLELGLFLVPSIFLLLINVR